VILTWNLIVARLSLRASMPSGQHPDELLIRPAAVITEIGTLEMVHRADRSAEAAGRGGGGDCVPLREPLETV